MTNPTESLVACIQANDADSVRQVIERYPELKAQLDEPLPGLAFDAPALLSAVWQGNRQMIDVLLHAGADINARSRWWARGFGVLDGADPGLVPFLVERGASVDAHAAARLGMRERLEELVSAHPALVHARGGDGQTPLHVAATVDIARFLLDRDADVNARDIDHESTPAQYMVRDRQDVARYLVTRGGRTDILMAAALGDLDLVRRHFDSDPACIRTSVSEKHFPKQDPRSGGTIYIWTLGWHKTPHAVAWEFGHEAVLGLLMDRSPEGLKLAETCQRGDEKAASALQAQRPDLAQTLEDDDRVRLANAAQNNNTPAVRLMLAAGWPVDVRGQHRATPLHWAAFHGNAEMVREILRYRPPIDIRGDEYDGTPLGWAIYGSEHGWHCKTGDYAGTVEALLQAGAQPPAVTADLEASEAVRAVLRRHSRETGGASQAHRGLIDPISDGTHAVLQACSKACLEPLEIGGGVWAEEADSLSQHASAANPLLTSATFSNDQGYWAFGNLVVLHREHHSQLEAGAWALRAPAGFRQRSPGAVPQRAARR